MTKGTEVCQEIEGLVKIEFAENRYFVEKIFFYKISVVASIHSSNSFLLPFRLLYEY